MIVSQLKTDLQRALKRLDFDLPEIELGIPDNSTHGDYTTNVALQLSKPASKKYLIEYGHPNFLKEIHIGHQRSFILGESLSRILEFLGHQVFRANYQGDIGLHIAKAIFGIQKLGLPKEGLDLEAKAKFLGK